MDWFNALDANYKIDLRELNDRNWERFNGEFGTHRSELNTEPGMMRAEVIPSARTGD